MMQKPEDGKLEVLVKKKKTQARAAHQETAGGRFSCVGLLVLLCKLLVLGETVDNNACGGAIRYKGHIFKRGLWTDAESGLHVSG